MYADTQVHMRSDDALIRFNQVMQMQTFALSDDVWHSAFRQKFNEWEQSKTRLVRVDTALESLARSGRGESGESITPEYHSSHAMHRLLACYAACSRYPGRAFTPPVGPKEQCI